VFKVSSLCFHKDTAKDTLPVFYVLASRLTGAVYQN